MAKKLEVITRTFSALYNILDDADLSKAGLSLSDYRECRRLMPLLGAPGSRAETIIEKAADFFKEHGYTVVSCGIGFAISI